jgi:hypothetical protein
MAKANEMIEKLASFKGRQITVGLGHTRIHGVLEEVGEEVISLKSDNGLTRSYAQISRIDWFYWNT